MVVNLAVETELRMSFSVFVYSCLIILSLKVLQLT